MVFIGSHLPDNFPPTEHKTSAVDTQILDIYIVLFY